MPAIVANFRSFGLDPADPLDTGILITDNVLQEGQGQHGGFDRADTFNFMAATGPDFKRGYVDPAPASNADIAQTIASIINLNLPSSGRLNGRVMLESLAGHPDFNARSTRTRLIESKPADNGLRTVVRFSEIGTERYFDAAGFPGRTNGL
jgi:hypothetical protein